MGDSSAAYSCAKASEHSAQGDTAFLFAWVVGEAYSGLVADYICSRSFFQ